MGIMLNQYELKKDLEKCYWLDNNGIDQVGVGK